MIVMETKRIQDVQVGDVLYFPILGYRTVTEISTDVKSCRHGDYALPQIMFSYVGEAWGNNWNAQTTDTVLTVS